MKKDIENRKDLYIIVDSFYKKLMNDDLMSHFFEDFKDPIHLEEHLQTLVDFWDNILFYTGAYQKNAMKPHINLQSTKPFGNEHFNQWLSFFNASVDQNYLGENAHIIKSRALSIATVMKIKVSDYTKR